MEVYGLDQGVNTVLASEFYKEKSAGEDSGRDLFSVQKKHKEP